MGPGCTSELYKKCQNSHCNEFTNDSKKNIFNYFWLRLNWGSRNVYYILPIIRQPFNP